MTFRLLALIALVLIGSACTKRSPEVPRWVWEKKIDVEELTRTTVRYMTRMQRERKLELEDSRVYYTDCVGKIRLVISSQELYEICEARVLFTDFIEGYLQALNNNPSIRADMCSQPFVAEDLDVYINFESFFGEYVDPFYVGWIELNDGLVNYYMFTLKQYHYDRWHSRTEPYWKALEIARAQKEADTIYPPNVSTGENLDQAQGSDIMLNSQPGYTYRTPYVPAGSQPSLPPAFAIPLGGNQPAGYRPPLQGSKPPQGPPSPLQPSQNPQGSSIRDELKERMQQGQQATQPSPAPAAPSTQPIPLGM